MPVLASGPANPDKPSETGSSVLSGRVLIVDDDPDVRDALGRLLSQWGTEVYPMHNLHQVMNDLQAAPDVVLADYQLLNGETGLMVARVVHKRWGAQIPIVLITGDTRTETIRVLRQSGFPILHKPVRANQLRTLLMTLLQGRAIRQIGG